LTNNRSLRRVGIKLDHDQTTETTLDLDSHADTSVLGAGALIFLDYDRPVIVEAYDPRLGSAQYSTVSGAVAYDDPHSGRTLLLVINQAIHIPHLDHHLLCPMQCRVNDVTVDETPKFLARDPTETTHALTLTDPDDPLQTVTLPLRLRGVISFLNVRTPTVEQFNDQTIPRLELTSQTLTWDPQTTAYADQEAAMMDFTGAIVTRTRVRDQFPTIIRAMASSRSHTDLIDLTHDDYFAAALLARVVVSSAQTRPDQMTSDQTRPNQTSTGFTPALTGNVRARTTPGIDFLTLARRWGISPDAARQTLSRTTQRGVRTCLNPTLSRRFPTNDRMLRYNRLPHPCFTDTLVSGTTSRRGHKYAQVYSTSFGWSRAYPLTRKGDAHQTLSLLFQRDGIPPAMIMDGSKEQTQGDFRRKLREADCHLRQTEPYSPWMNAAEGCIRELKRGTSRKMIKTGSPKTLWDHCIELESLIRSSTCNSIYMTNGETPETIMTGQTADISHICEFGWFDWVMFRDNVPTFPDDRMILGRYLGPATDVGSALTAKILKSNGQFVCRSTLRHLTDEELQCPTHKTLRDDFMTSILAVLGRPARDSDFPAEDMTPDPDHMEPLDLDPNFTDLELKTDSDLKVSPEAADNYVGAEISFPRGGILKRGRVTSRKRDLNGDLIGLANDNRILDTREYVVKFEDGDEAELNANLIAASMYENCDPDGHEYFIFDSITDHRKLDNAIRLSDQTRIQPNGRAFKRRSTIGWQLCCLWRDGSTSWIDLKDLKESHPVQTAEYAISAGIDHEPAFNWWVHDVFKRRDRIISLVKKRETRYLKRTHKYGVRVPKTVQQALDLDRQNGNTLWADAISKEMKNVRVAFNILPDGTTAPGGYKKIPCHMIFDVKMVDFARKARLVAGGHLTDTPPAMTYASVVSRETVRIALTIAALNSLDVKTGDVMNAYITAPITEKVWTILGPEFGADTGRHAIIVRALYGLKSAGAAFRAHLASFMRHMGYASCKADPDLWYKAQTNPTDNTRYYAYILCYVDDILVIHHDPMTVLTEIHGYMPLKDPHNCDPTIYLGTKLRETQLPNGIWAWGMSPSKYVNQAVNNTESQLTEEFGGRFKLPTRADNPFPTTYDPDTDVSDPLDPSLSSFYAHLIGMMRWMVEIGRVDIATEISLLSSYLAYPRLGHLLAALHVMAYLKAKHNTRLIFDPTYPKIDASMFPKRNWDEFYGKVSEAIPDNMPPPLGKDVDLRMWVDSDHAGEKRTRRSRTGFFIYINMACIDWVSKRQPTIETSVFGAEFVAMKHGVEKLRGLRYKLRMMGVPVLGPSYIYGDNKSAITNSSTPESVLKKKCNSICYHACRESVAMDESRFAHIRTTDNWADLLTKVTHGPKRRDLVKNVLYDIYDHN